MEIIWSAKARITFFVVLDYLEKNWNKTEIIQFKRKTELVIQAIKKIPVFLLLHQNINTSGEPSLTKTTLFIIRWTKKMGIFTC